MNQKVSQQIKVRKAMNIQSNVKIFNNIQNSDEIYKVVLNPTIITPTSQLINTVSIQLKLFQKYQHPS